MSISLSTNSHQIIKDQDYRCPKCSLVPFIYISNDENKLFMSIKCTNNHIYSKNFDEMQIMCRKNQISNCICDKCKIENKKNSNISFYCSSCYKFFCFDHREFHKLKENHQVFFLNNNLDSICFEHNGKSCLGYCSVHNKNYCKLCFHYDENNKKIEEDLNEEQIKKYEIEINENKNVLDKIEILFNNYKEMFKKLEENFSLYKENTNKKINFMNEMLKIYKRKKNENDINYQMKANIENNHFNLSKFYQILKNNLDIQLIKINELINLFRKNETKFDIKKMNNFFTFNNNKGSICCLKILNDGRLAASDTKSNLIIYNLETYKPDIIIQNNLGCLINFIQLKNNNLVCSLENDFSLKILKINKYEYENIQIIKNAHKKAITKIIEIKNKNIITFSWDYSFKIWKLNNNNKYEKINEIVESYRLSDGIEIKDNEILYFIGDAQKSLVFYDLEKNEKIKILNNIYLSSNDVGEKIIKLNDNEVVVAGYKNIYLIDINNYQILHEFDCDNNNFCILKLSKDLFLTGDKKGTITQYMIKNNKINKESSKINCHENKIFSMAKLNDIIISGGFDNNIIKFWKI